MNDDGGATDGKTHADVVGVLLVEGRVEDDLAARLRHDVPGRNVGHARRWLHLGSLGWKESLRLVGEFEAGLDRCG